ncbi:uncharacterized protein BT62DRAFT_921597 [Guyanagaster necrorhizus]|uniref:Uncharacterized protein n=1 Tax=Guyanagaster necrorhizus TaxID=856835 RepID=A0A9P8AQK9_9AGAR|nr:uncharacterized protein BT62DRAFT_921597 [Guyanagaster necrorhizus MCA 3950]KAG7443961.1 hypothetical protein BT62DRAFT_921597 [Guyanagaster necrorhizus MCA 3950]
MYNQDVLICLVSIEGDSSGDEHYKAIQHLSKGQTAFRGDNYLLSLLNKLEFNGLRFIVFPLLTFSRYILWFHNMAEILDYLVQIFKTQILRAGKLPAYPTSKQYVPEMLVGDPYCPFKADVWYLDQMLNADMDTEVKGFVEKIKSVSWTNSMQVFDEYMNKSTEVMGLPSY